MLCDAGDLEGALKEADNLIDGAFPSTGASASGGAEFQLAITRMLCSRDAYSDRGLGLFEKLATR